MLKTIFGGKWNENQPKLKLFLRIDLICSYGFLCMLDAEVRNDDEQKDIHSFDRYRIGIDQINQIIHEKAV